MDTNTDKQSVLAALPASFTPITNPPDWTKPKDLDLYTAAWRPEDAPVLPANATTVDAYRHALNLLSSAVTEIKASLAVRTVFNAGQIDPQCVHELRNKPSDELIDRFRYVDIRMANEDPDTQRAIDVRIYVNDQADESVFLLDELERLLDCHTWKPGHVSLMELHELTTRIGGLSCALAEDNWNSEAFGELFDEVAAPLRETGCMFLYTSPEPGTCMRTLWRLADNNDEGK